MFGLASAISSRSSRKGAPLFLLVLAPLAGGFLVVTPAGTYALRTAVPAGAPVVVEITPKSTERRDASDAIQLAAEDDSPRFDGAPGPAGSPAAHAAADRPPLSLPSRIPAPRTAASAIPAHRSSPPAAPLRGPPASAT